MSTMHKKGKMALRLLLEQFQASDEGGSYAVADAIHAIKGAGGLIPVARRLFKATVYADVMDTATGESTGRQQRNFVVAAASAQAARALVIDAVLADPQVSHLCQGELQENQTVADRDVEIVQLTGHVYLTGAEGGQVTAPQPAQPVPAATPEAEETLGEEEPAPEGGIALVE
jgi:hypothetical protein